MVRQLPAPQLAVNTRPASASLAASLVMAYYRSLSRLALLLMVPTTMAITCPGFPGYCSESFPGQTCNVVCSRGRNNVPLCQEDGTWTDLPRCIEHDPGVEEQIAGLCPGISGYCSQSFYDGRCNFKCHTGPDIHSVCTHDGTWEPYPTCQGDLRETQDGCNGCPGPLGKIRNRTAEAILNRQASQINNRINHNRVPKSGSIDSDPVSNGGMRKAVPSFAGIQKFGRIKTSGGAGHQSGNSRPSNIQTRFESHLQLQQNNEKTQRKPTQQSFNIQRPVQQQFQSFRKQQQDFSSQQPQVPQQAGPNAKPLTLFDQIRKRINSQKSSSINGITSQSRRVTNSSPASQLSTTSHPRIAQRLTSGVRPASAPQSKQTRPQEPSTFGVFESVDLSNSLSPLSTQDRQKSFADIGSSGPSPPNDGFFGVFQEVNLQG